MKNKINSILILCLLFFLSCETDGNYQGDDRYSSGNVDFLHTPFESIGTHPGNGEDFYSVKDFYLILIVRIITIRNIGNLIY